MPKKFHLFTKAFQANLWLCNSFPSFFPMFPAPMHINLMDWKENSWKYENLRDQRFASKFDNTEYFVLYELNGLRIVFQDQLPDVH